MLHHSFFTVTTKKIVFFFAVYIISRLWSINSGDIFFDSLEYIRRFSIDNYLASLSQGHLPLHSGYPAIGWPMYHISAWIGINPVYPIMLFQVFLSALAIAFFYKTTRLFFDETTAAIASILLSLSPLLWISTTTVMMEGIYLPFFIASVYYSLRFVKNTECSFSLAAASTLCFGFALFTHVGIILWTPTLILIVFLSKRQWVLYFTLLLGLSCAGFILLNSYFISTDNNTSLGNGVFTLLTGKLQEKASVDWSIHSLFVLFRNAIIPLFRNNTILIVLLAFFSLAHLVIQRNKYALIFLVWTAPFILANQWWDSLFIGRHSLPITYALCMLAAYAVRKKPVIAIILILYLLVSVIPAILLLRTETPYQALGSRMNVLPQNGLYIESHFARPQVEHRYYGRKFFVDEPGYDHTALAPMIITYLADNKPVFISSQALSEPYGLYAGPYLHTLSLSYKNPYRLSEIIKKFHLQQLPDNSRSEIALYQISSYQPSAYPNVPQLQADRRRIDFSDPLIQGWIRIQYIFTSWSKHW